LICFDLDSLISPEKANLFERRGRKATGLISKQKMAELPKDKLFGMLGFLLGGAEMEDVNKKSIGDVGK
jgi:hypothetical protein